MFWWWFLDRPRGAISWALSIFLVQGVLSTFILGRLQLLPIDPDLFPKPVARCLKAINLDLSELCTLSFCSHRASCLQCPSPHSSPRRENQTPSRPPALLWSPPQAEFLSPHSEVLPTCSGPTDENWLVTCLCLTPACEFLEGRDHGLFFFRAWHRAAAAQ